MRFIASWSPIKARHKTAKSLKITSRGFIYAAGTYTRELGRSQLENNAGENHSHNTKFLCNFQMNFFHYASLSANLYPQEVQMAD